MQRLNAKVALITGGTQSIGKGIADLFYQQGALVIITGRRSIEEGQDLARQIGPEVLYMTLDVSKEGHWIAVLSQIVAQHGRLDILVNNAGIEYPAHSLGAQNPEDCSLADWQEVNHTN